MVIHAASTIKIRIGNSNYQNIEDKFMTKQQNRFDVKYFVQDDSNDRNCKRCSTTISSESISMQRYTASSKLKLLAILAVIQLSRFTTTSGYQTPNPNAQTMNNNRPTFLLHDRNNRYRFNPSHFKAQQYALFSSTDEWSSFQAMDDDDEIVFGKVLDKQEYAVENDSQGEKEAVGALRSAPIIERNADPISVPAGETKKIRVHFNIVPI